jgi:hypothetical protein
VNRRRSRRTYWLALVLILLVPAFLGPGTASAQAAPLSTSSFGFGMSGEPADLALGSSYGAAQARHEVVGNDADSMVTLLANAHLRLYAILGVPCPSSTPNCRVSWSPTPGEAATQISQVVTAFARRYGVGGSFWSEHPKLPYEPVTDFEIGNEENLPVYWVVDSTHLHWNAGQSGQSEGSAEYATVYHAARSALRQVDPTATAVVGGLADSASLGVDVQLDERYLAALNPTPGASAAVDAVGYHDWVYDVSTASTLDAKLKADTVDLSTWMHGHGYSSVPLHVNEYGACYTTSTAYNGGQCSPQHSITDAQWGPIAADYAKWAMCTASLKVDHVLPFYYGDIPGADSGLFWPMVSESDTLTTFGTDYLSLVRTLTTSGCPSQPSGSPPVNSAPPTVQGQPVVGAWLTGSSGTWTQSPQFSYQWDSCGTAGTNCSAIGGATSSRYQVESSDVGRTLILSVSAVNGAGGGEARSAPTKVITGLAGAPTAAPTGGPTPPGASTTPGAPTPTGAATSTRASRPTARLAPMAFRVVRISRHHHAVTVLVTRIAGSGAVIVTAVRRHGHQRRAVRCNRHGKSSRLLTFRAKLPKGRWVLTISARPTLGYAAPKAQRRDVDLRR